ncbi:class I adenylate-forming enzyme family protein [Baekduia soli]|nr:AMP-binding protein [Baekduia soli]
MTDADWAQLRELPGDETPLQMFDRTVGELGERPLLYSFETPLPAAQVAELVDGVAAGLAAMGAGRGDRVGLYLQNDPQFVIAMLAAWRIGAVAVPCNPMLRERELAHHLHDAGATLLVTLDELYRDVARAAVQADGIRVITTSARALAGAEAPVPEGTTDLLALAREHAGAPVPGPAPGPGDVAVLTYTSGTTGPPKGAMNTHGNIAFGSRVYRDALGVGPQDIILGIAPLYHVTGLVGHIGLSVASGASMVLAHRFDAAEAARLAEHHRTTVTIAAITAYLAIANDEQARGHDLGAMRRTYSGGAPIPPATVRVIAQATGMAVKPVYGLTETTGPTHLCPVDREAPVDAGSGALSVGLAVPDTSVRILGDDGTELPHGEVGEVCIRGPQVVPGYWERPEETAHAIPGGELHTGDVGVVDADGWLYLVDRRKDMIVASGFKVWPREVEDVLYEHAAVHEAAVIGVPDDYRGETVWAYVSLKAGATCTPEELKAHCKERLAAYKYPRVVHVLPELPKTPTGKILRRELRDAAVPPPVG